MKTMVEKTELLAGGLRLILDFCRVNNLYSPPVMSIDSPNWKFSSACAYYRRNQITICVARCAAIGRAGRSWSFPGYCVDRTPYGVLAHELGHHVDFTMDEPGSGPYWSGYGKRAKAETGETPLTTYCPNPAEWFAEMFRLFLTNPDLLRQVRPRTYEWLRKDFKPVEKRQWDEVLAPAPERTLIAAQRKIAEAQRRAGR